MARYDFSEDRETARVRLLLLRCEHEPCSRVWQRAERPGPPPRFCSDACKQANYRVVRKLDGPGRRAHAARQELRRKDWADHEAELWRDAQERRRRRLEPAGTRSGETPEAGAVRLTGELEALAGAIAAARARGSLGAEAQAAFYTRFTDLEAAVAGHAETVSSRLEDAQAALQLVRLQVSGLLTDGADLG